MPLVLIRHLQSWLLPTHFPHRHRSFLEYASYHVTLQPRFWVAFKHTSGHEINILTVLQLYSHCHHVLWRFTHFAFSQVLPPPWNAPLSAGRVLFLLQLHLHSGVFPTTHPNPGNMTVLVPCRCCPLYTCPVHPLDIHLSHVWYPLYIPCTSKLCLGRKWSHIKWAEKLSCDQGKSVPREGDPSGEVYKLFRKSCQQCPA